MPRKIFYFLTIILVILILCIICRCAFAFWGFGRPGIYIREDISDDRDYVTELFLPEGSASVSGSVATLSLSSFDVSDDPGDAYTLTSDNLTGRNIITNDGAGAKRTYNLPNLTSARKIAYIYAEEDQSVDINPDSSDRIYDLTDATGDAIETKGLGNFIILINHDATGWYPHQFIGTWSDVN